MDPIYRPYVSDDEDFESSEAQAAYDDYWGA
jgi:hypothetical protein